MSTVELLVSTDLLPEFDRIRDQLGGRETGRRPHADRDDVTILDMQMDDAPAAAVRMEVYVEKIRHTELRAADVRYFDTDGNDITPPPDSVQDGGP